MSYTVKASISLKYETYITETNNVLQLSFGFRKFVRGLIILIIATNNMIISHK